MLIALSIILSAPLQALPSDSVGRVHTDMPTLNEQHYLTATIYYKGFTAKDAILYYRCYKYAANGDSALVCRKDAKRITLNGDLQQQNIQFTESDGPAYYLPVFYNILRKTGSVPAGPYKVFLELRTDSAVILQRSFIHNSDSSLAATSPLRKELNQTLVPEKKAKILGISFAKEAKAVNSLASNTAKTVDRAAGKVDRLFKSKGLTSVTEKRNGKDIISLYYEDWFVGRYEVSLDQSLNAQVQKQQNALTQPVTSLVTNELGSYQSLLSQVKEMTKLKKEDRELTGDIELTGNWASSQEPYSQQDNNFYELRGNIETTIQDMPIGIEGYYTTQDKNRTVKASYIRVHYDADKAKGKLAELIGGFKNQFSQTLSKGAGLSQIYGSYLDNLKGQEKGLLTDLKKETGVSDINTGSLDTNGLKAKITDGLQQKATDTAFWKETADSNGIKIDSAGKLRRTEARAAKLADSANRIYQKALKKYQRLVALEQTAEKYYKLIDQYKNTSYFDSTLGYDKMKDFDKQDVSTYKQMAKAASGLLPEGKAKKFITGLTNLDLGIFPKELSSYTMAGQQLKGIDAGYDLGFCQVGATYGSTEFVGRDGTLDKYAAYSGRVQFKPAKGQKVNIVYYGYTPSKKAMDKDTFFKDMDLAVPTFKEPVHIVSAAYAGRIAKKVTVDGEIATSFRQGSGEALKDNLSADKIAYHLNASGMIPKTSIMVDAGYEHGGTNFQNSTLPVNIAGTDILKVASKGDFFKAFLTLGVEFNHIEQHSFVSTGNNNKWGFEIATHSKQYPSVSLSYKPYTTFRSYTDTLAIPQRPLVGAVWTGKATYQIKKTGGRAWRFSAVYNRSTSAIDTTSYGSNLIQANVIYSTKKWMVMGSVGNVDQSTTGLSVPNPNGTATATDGTARARTTFGMLSGSCPLSKSTTITGGFDLGFAPFGFSKYGVNAGLSYRLKKVPLSIRGMGRYSGYELDPVEGWKHIYGGSLDLLWQFKMKLKK